jgi:hypothetical protein
MKVEPVKTKTNFVKRYDAGEFGNASPTWKTIADFLQATTPFTRDGVMFHIRNRVKGGPTWYNVDGYDLPHVWEQCCRAGAYPADLYISAMAPTDKTQFQGEVMLTEECMEVFGSTIRKPMRDALKEQPVHLKGLVASLTLKTYMNARSWDWLNELFDNYPEHVIEFSCYSHCWGTVPGFNTVFWEVRQY